MQGRWRVHGTGPARAMQHAGVLVLMVLAVDARRSGWVAGIKSSSSQSTHIDYFGYCLTSLASLRVVFARSTFPADWPWRCIVERRPSFWFAVHYKSSSTYTHLPGEQTHGASVLWSGAHPLVAFDAATWSRIYGLLQGCAWG